MAYAGDPPLQIDVPAPDGVALATDVYGLGTSRARRPAILLRTPYNKSDLAGHALALDLAEAIAAGFVPVLQDVRGRWSSGGAFDAKRSDGADGAATLAWIRQQPWSSGDVVTAGGSFSGAVQLLTAGLRPEGLRAIAPWVTGAEREIWLPGGALRLQGVIAWTDHLVEAALRRDPSEVERSALEAFRDAGPLEQLHEALAPSEALAPVLAPIASWFRADPADPFWELVGVPSTINVPASHLSGWYDVCLGPTVAARTRLKELGAPRQDLVIGPWGHDGQVAEGAALAMPGGGDAWKHGHLLQFFERALAHPAEEQEPGSVRCFVLGANRWATYDDWPPPHSRSVTWHLAVSPDSPAGVTGSLRPETTSPVEGSATYVYDPADPTPSLGGATCTPQTCGAHDVAALHRRPDVLVFRGDPLQEPLHIAGRVRAALTLDSSAVATDFLARLVMYLEGGAVVVLCEGCWSGRLVELEPAGTLTAGRRCTIDLGHIDVEVAAGRRIALQLCSSSFPEIFPNPNTGHRLADGPPSHTVRATQTIRTGPGAGSTLSFDVLWP